MLFSPLFDLAWRCPWLSSPGGATLGPKKLLCPVLPCVCFESSSLANCAELVTGRGIVKGTAAWPDETVEEFEAAVRAMMTDNRSGGDERKRAEAKAEELPQPP